MTSWSECVVRWKHVHSGSVYSKQYDTAKSAHFAAHFAHGLWFVVIFWGQALTKFKLFLSGSLHSPHRQCCWVEFHPASIMAEHGKRTVVACQLAVWGWFSVVLISYDDQHCDSTSISEIWNRGMFPKVRYQSWISVGMLGGKRQEILGGNYFHPASSRYPTHWKLYY